MRWAGVTEAATVRSASSHQARSAQEELEQELDASNFLLDRLAQPFRECGPPLRGDHVHGAPRVHPDARTLRSRGDPGSALDLTSAVADTQLIPTMR